MAYRNFYDVLRELAQAHEASLKRAKSEGLPLRAASPLRGRFREEPVDQWQVDVENIQQVGKAAARVPGNGDSQVPLIRCAHNLGLSRLQSRMLEEYYEAKEAATSGINLLRALPVGAGWEYQDADDDDGQAPAMPGSGASTPKKVHFSDESFGCGVHDECDSKPLFSKSGGRRNLKFTFKDPPLEDDEIERGIPLPRFAQLDHTPPHGRGSLVRMESMLESYNRDSKRSDSSILSVDVQEKWGHLSRTLLAHFPVTFRWPLPVFSRIISKPISSAEHHGARMLGSMDLEAIMIRARSASSRIGSARFSSRKLRASIMAGAQKKNSDVDFWKYLEGWQALTPHSKTNVFWVVLGCMCLLFDLIFIPLQFVGLAETDGFNTIGTCVLIYWTVDVVLQFGTGYYVGDSVERRFLQVAKMYARTWMLFDLFCTVPLWVVVYAVKSSEHEETLRALRLVKFARVVRIPRMVRMIKGERLVRQALEAINSQTLLLSFGIFKTMASLVLFNHIAACIWLGIGQSNPIGWTHTVPDLVTDESSPLHLYLIATHWALTQFQGTSEVLPETPTERLYAVCYVASAIINLAMFVSSLTNRISQLQSLHEERTRGLRSIDTYLATHGVSGQLSVRIKRYVNWRLQLKKKSTENDGVMDMLPDQLLSDLHLEVRGPLLIKHHFFNHVNSEFPRVIQQLCHDAVKPFIPGPKEVIFQEGNICANMFIVASGIMQYKFTPRIRLGRHQHVSVARQNIPSLSFISWLPRFTQSSDISTGSETSDFDEDDASQIFPGDWLAEAALWTHWEHVGQLTDVEVSSLLLLGTNAFADTLRTSPRALHMAALYCRRFCVAISQYGHIFTDWLDYGRLFENDLP